VSKNGRRKPAFWLLAAFFALFVLFLYGPTITIVILSFQGPSGGLTFPMRGLSLYWFGNLFERQMVGDFGGWQRVKKEIVDGLWKERVLKELGK